jgi:hypothetical protein
VATQRPRTAHRGTSGASGATGATGPKAPDNGSDG